jgi:hypothetical protein
MKVGSQTEARLEFGPDDSEWLNVDEAAEYLRIFSRDGRPCSARVRNLCTQGRIPFYKPYGRLLFRRSELERLVASSRNGEAKCQ